MIAQPPPFPARPALAGRKFFVDSRLLGGNGCTKKVKLVKLGRSNSFWIASLDVVADVVAVTVVVVVEVVIAVDAATELSQIANSIAHSNIRMFPQFINIKHET